MSDEHTSPQQQSDSQLDSALSSLPMQPMPSGLLASIMSEIQPAFVPEPLPQQLSDSQLDGALSSLPMQPMPSGLLASIMSEIRPAFVPEPFRLRVADVAMAALITAFFVMSIVIGMDLVGLTQWLPFSAELPQITWLTPTTTIALAVASLELLVIYLFSEAFFETS